MAFSVDRNSCPGRQWPLLPNSLPETAGVQAARRRQGPGRKALMMVQEPNGPKAAALLETIPKVDHLQADNGRERKCTEDPALARVGLVSRRHPQCLICAHACHGAPCVARPAGPGLLLPRVASCWTSVLCPSLTPLFSPEQSLLIRECIVLGEMRLPYRALEDQGCIVSRLQE